MIKKTLIIAAIFLLSIESFAESYYRNRTILGAGVYYVGSHSVLMFTVDGDKSNMVSCAGTKRFAINSSAPHYKELVSIVLTAYTSGQNNVDVYATESCTYIGNAQDILGVKMGEIVW